MSLLDDFSRTCVLMEKKRVSDGEGGYYVEWADGVEFKNYQALDASMEARRAEKEGVTSVYRVTSNPEDKQAPKSSTLPLKFFTAERKALTK